MNATTAENASTAGPQRPVELSGIDPRDAAARRTTHRLLLLSGIGRERISRFNSSL